MSKLIEIDGKRYSTVGIEVEGEPVFILDNSAEGGSVTLASFDYIQNVGYYVKQGDEKWSDLADVVYIRTPDSLGLTVVSLENVVINGKVFTHAVSATTGKPLYTWQA